MKSLKTHWHHLQERERWLLVAGILAATLFVYYYFIYSPLATNLEKNTIQLLEQKQTLQWMKQINPDELPDKQVKAISNSQLLTLLANQLKESTSLKYPFQLQQTGSGDIQLSFEQVPFENLIAWLAGLGENYNVTLKQFNVEKTDKVGITRVMIIISAGK